jgi:hypothetical protein
MVKAGIAGVANAPAFLAGLPGDVASLASDAGNFIGNRIGDAMGLPPLPEGVESPIRRAAQKIGGQAMRRRAGDVLQAAGVSDAQNAFRYEPRRTNYVSLLDW